MWYLFVKDEYPQPATDKILNGINVVFVVWINSVEINTVLEKNTHHENLLWPNLPT